MVADSYVTRLYLPAWLFSKMLICTVLESEECEHNSPLYFKLIVIVYSSTIEYL